jgi:hypothetical protein
MKDANRLVLKNLRILEVAGYTSCKNECQSIITDLSRDILNQKDHRIHRIHGGIAGPVQAIRHTLPG